MTAQERFASLFTVVADGCWLWLGPRTGNGYGRFNFAGRGDYAHRVSCTWANGPIPAGLVVDHLCRNRACVNPAHLEVVTHSENIRRGAGAAYQRDKTHCPHGHLYDEKNTRRYKGKRICRVCDGSRKKVGQ